MPKKYPFTLEKTNRLIAEIKNHPWIWDMEHEDYKDRLTLAKSWDELETMLDTPALHLKIKWKALRDTYKKELKKFDEGKYLGTWRHFQNLRFLVFKSDANDTDDIQIDKRPETEEYEVKIESVEPSEEIYMAEDPIQDSKPFVDEEFDVMFLRSLTPYLRQLEPMRRLVVRNKMQDMLLSELTAQNATKGHCGNR